MGSLFREPAADLIAVCQVVSDVQTPLAHASVADALVVVVVVELSPLEPQPAATNATETTTVIRLSVRVDVIVMSLVGGGRGRRVCPPLLRTAG